MGKQRLPPRFPGTSLPQQLLRPGLGGSCPHRQVCCWRKTRYLLKRGGRVSRSCKHACLLIDKREVFRCCLGQFKPSLASCSPRAVLGLARGGLMQREVFLKSFRNLPYSRSLWPPTILLAASHPRQPGQARLQAGQRSYFKPD